MVSAWVCGCLIITMKYFGITWHHCFFFFLVTLRRGMWDLSPGIKPVPPAVERPSANRQTIREVSAFLSIDTVPEELFSHK